MSHLNNASGAIITGGVSQELLDPGSVNGFMFRNVSAGSLWIKFGNVPATMDNLSLEIKAGEFYETPAQFRPCSNRINIIGATTGQAFFCEVW